MTCMMIKKDQLTRYKQTQVYAHKEQLKQVRKGNENRANKCFFSPLVFGVRFCLSHFTISSLLFSLTFRRLSMSSLGNDDCNSKGANRNVVLKKSVRAVVAIL